MRNHRRPVLPLLMPHPQARPELQLRHAVRAEPQIFPRDEPKPDPPPHHFQGTDDLAHLIQLLRMAVG